MNNNYFTSEDLSMFSKYQTSGIEMRGIWHMPHMLINFGYDERTLDGVKKLLDRIKEAGFNTILIETTMKAHTIYKSNVATVHPDFDFNDNQYGKEYKDDYFQCFIGEAHKRNIKVHAWTSTMRAGKLENSLVESLPKAMKEEWIARGFHGEYGLDGKYGELMWLDPSNQEVENYLLKQYIELVTKYDIDGIELDAIRYPVSNLKKVQNEEELNDFGYTTGAIKQFKDKYIYHGNLKEEILNNELLQDNWIKFRSELITKMVEKIRNVVLGLKPNLPISAAVFMDSKNALNEVCQDWPRWIEKGWLDFVSPMAYTLDDNKVLISYNETEALVKDNAFNLQGIASIIEGGDYKTHFTQMLLINQLRGLGSILFSIRQFLKDEKLIEAVKLVYNNNPAISPLEPIEDIIKFVLPLIEEKVKIPELKNSLFKIDTNNYDQLIKELKRIQNELSDDDHLVYIIESLIKTIKIKTYILSK